MKNFLFCFLVFFLSFLMAQENELLLQIDADSNNQLVFSKECASTQILYQEKFGATEKEFNTKKISIPYALFLSMNSDFIKNRSYLFLKINEEDIEITQEKSWIFQKAFSPEGFRLKNNKYLSKIKTIQLFHSPFPCQFTIQNSGEYSGKLSLKVADKVDSLEIKANQSSYKINLWRGNYTLELDSQDYIVEPPFLQIPYKESFKTIQIKKKQIKCADNGCIFPYWPYYWEDCK